METIKIGEEYKIPAVNWFHPEAHKRSYGWVARRHKDKYIRIYNEHNAIVMTLPSTLTVMQIDIWCDAYVRGFANGQRMFQKDIRTMLGIRD